VLAAALEPNPAPEKRSPKERRTPELETALDE